ncbi:hypothetical protein [Streptomyces olindensis]|uniref:hypothetical protein n=1 Tax=Streptomyces olindensis TaxID=358823 RepID=UPI0033D7FF9D
MATSLAAYQGWRSVPSGAGELAASDHLPDGVQADAEDAGGLVGGEAAGPDDVRLLKSVRR